MSIIKRLTGYDKNESAAWKKGYWEGAQLILWIFLPVFMLLFAAYIFLMLMP